VIPIPNDPLYANSLQNTIKDQLENNLGAVGSFIGATAMGQSRISWEVRAQLDVPMKLDINK